MITVDEWASIRVLKDKGNSIKQIAKILKMRRNTVRKVLRSESSKDYGGNKKNEIARSKSKAAAYHEKILEMLIKDKFIGSRILTEIKKLGYGGSKTSFYEYLSRLKLKCKSLQVEYEI